LTFKQIIKIAMSGSLAAVALVALACYWADPFYLFHREPIQGADVSFYDNDRLFKYWLAQRFVPLAYDGIILGPSYAVSLEPGRVAGASHLYNLAFRGANSSEMRTLGESVAAAPGVKTKVAFVCVDPYVLRSRNPRTESMKPATLRMAYGSWPLLSHFFQRAFFPLSPLANYFSLHGANNEYQELEAGDHTPYITREIEKAKSRYEKPFKVKEVALKNMRALVSALRKSGIRVVAFIPPKPKLHREVRRANYRAFVEKYRSELGPVDEFLDFTEEPLDDSYFLDGGGHLSVSGSDWLLGRLVGYLP
jgi:hypothetical protein